MVLPSLAAVLVPLFEPGTRPMRPAVYYQPAQQRANQKLPFHVAPYSAKVTLHALLS